MPVVETDLRQRVLELKKERNAIILAHSYQTADIQEVADYVGDSLGLAYQAKETDADVILFCGVHFMAETAKIVNPGKPVLLPDLDAGCSLADSCPADQLKAAIAVQPTSPAHFAKRLAHDMTGPLSKLVLPMTNWFIELGGGMRMRETDPLYAAPSAGQTPVLFVQGAGDKWGSVENVTEIAAATPNTIDLIIAAEATDRYSGYQYIIDNPHIAISFFDDYLV